MSFVKDKLLALVRQLFPTGRAFKMPENSYMEQLHSALSNSEERFYNDATSILYDILPDNNNFTTDDATDWERRLGLITNTLTSLNDRKAAILRKLNQPGKNPAKGSHLYIQEQLQAAGFNVYVYENRFLYYYPEQFITKKPIDILPLGYYLSLGDGQLGDGQLGDPTTYYGSLIVFNQLGSFQLGSAQLDEYIWKDQVANNIDVLKDQTFNIGLNYRSTFFVCGPTLGSFANVPLSRKDEFRQTIIKLKPAQTVGFLFINYT